MDTAPQAPARLLVVDDQVANIQVLGRLLGREGYEIIPATTGELALKRFGVRPPALVLLDVLMDDMDGFEVCRRIRSNPDWAEIPVIFLSAADDKRMIVRALEAGGVDYVTKPFNQAELVSRVRTHLALKAARDRLKRLAEDKDELLGILTHDCKSHLGGMNMTAQLLHERAQSLGDPRLSRMAENIERSSGQMLSFVKRFLANTAADRGLNLNRKPLVLWEAVSRVALEHESSARRKELTLRTEFAGDSAQAAVDESGLEQVVDNLVSNAIKFSPPGKEIIAGVRATGTKVECFVSDQGPGFTDADRPRMFRRYSRLSARPTGGEPSTGLGLSIAKKLVEEMGGELICETSPGAGATFIARFDRVPTT